MRIADRFAPSKTCRVLHVYLIILKFSI